MKIKELRSLLKKSLEPLYGKNEGAAVAGYYLAETFPGKNGKLTEDDFYELEDSQVEITNEDIRRLASGEPVQYVTSRAWFYGYPFVVNNNVLIPRPETEELVELILSENNNEFPLQIIDIGTGSGCIAILLKLKKPASELTATDISAGVLEVAKQNAQKFNTDILFVRDDITNSTLYGETRYDIIVSNPPYIPYNEKSNLSLHVTDHEPHQALFAPENEPLYYYSAILDFASRQLAPGGKIYFEIHQDYGRQLQSLIKSAGRWEAVIITDISGNQRFVVIEENKSLSH